MFLYLYLKLQVNLYTSRILEYSNISRANIRIRKTAEFNNPCGVAKGIRDILTDLRGNGDAHMSPMMWHEHLLSFDCCSGLKNIVVSGNGARLSFRLAPKVFIDIN